jgi:hypothetical protein
MLKSVVIAAVAVGIVSNSFATVPRLAVAISIDQFRADYLVRFRPYFGPGGFNKLLEGADYQECHHRHAITKTAPGHAAMLSGVYANTSGIVGNDWLDRGTWQTMNAVEDPDSPIVGGARTAPHSPGGLLERKSGRSPRNFLATTVGDQLKLRFGAGSRVVAVSNKDRAAILMGGKLADGAYWMEAGRFVTSRYYGELLPSWVRDFDAQGRGPGYFGKTWDRLLPAADYEFTQGPDDVAGESLRFGLSRTFPQKIDGGHPDLRASFWDAFDASPFATDVLNEFALAALRQERLGLHPHPDLFCISYSQIDFVGHEFGPDSQELMDCVIRLDREIARLLAAVELQVGKGNYVVVLTADHGAAPLPEKLVSLGRGLVAARFHGAALDKAVAAALDSAFGPVPANDFWVTRDNFGYSFHPSALRAKGVSVAAAAAVIKPVILQSPEIARVFTGPELAEADPLTDSVLDMSRRSYFPGRSVDVAYILKPYVMDRDRFGINHGTPWDYDTHVPLVWYGAGVPAGVHPEPVAVEDLAPTLAALLQVPRPPQAKGRRLF